MPETDSGSEPSERLAIVAKLRAGSRDQAKEILAAGPPYDLDDAAFRRHTIFLGEDTVVFVFEGPGVRALLSKLIDDPASSASFSSVGAAPRGDADPGARGVPLGGGSALGGGRGGRGVRIAGPYRPPKEALWRPRRRR